MVGDAGIELLEQDLECNDAIQERYSATLKYNGAALEHNAATLGYDGKTSDLALEDQVEGQAVIPKGLCSAFTRAGRPWPSL